MTEHIHTEIFILGSAYMRFVLTGLTMSNIAYIPLPPI